MITGDLVNLATSIEIRCGRMARSIGDPLDTTVPGNHDAYVPGAHDRSVREWYPFIAADNDPNDWSDETTFSHLSPPRTNRHHRLLYLKCDPALFASGLFSSRQARETSISCVRREKKACFAS